jgi:hypothetical protein
MGGLVIKIKDFDETIEWNAHSLTVANFLRLGTNDDPIDMVRENQGDRHDGEIIFCPKEKQIIVDTDYFSMPKRALKFWRAIGFDIVLKSRRREL